jgi:hypothetical protein
VTIRPRPRRAERPGRQPIRRPDLADAATAAPLARCWATLVLCRAFAGLPVYLPAVMVAATSAGAAGVTEPSTRRQRRRHEDAARAMARLMEAVSPLHGAAVPPLHGVARAASRAKGCAAASLSGTTRGWYGASLPGAGAVRRHRRIQRRSGGLRLCGLRARRERPPPRPGVEVRPKPLSPTGQAGDQVVLRGWPAIFAGTAYAAANGEPWGQAGGSACQR